MEFATPTGKRAHAAAAEPRPGYIDPPLGASVTTAGGRRGRAASSTSPTGWTARSTSAAWVPERPYASVAELRCATMEAYYRELAAATDELVSGPDAYDAMLIVGGSGPIVDLANNEPAARR